MTISADQAHDRALKGKAALSRSFLDRAGGDRQLAERLRSEWYSELGRRSGSKRRAKAAAKRAAEQRALEGRGVTIVSVEELLAIARGQVKRRLSTHRADDRR
jgi:hypothetical protein